MFISVHLWSSLLDFALVTAPPLCAATAQLAHKPRGFSLITLSGLPLLLWRRGKGRGGSLLSDLVAKLPFCATADSAAGYRTSKDGSLLSLTLSSKGSKGGEGISAWNSAAAALSRCALRIWALGSPLRYLSVPNFSVSNFGDFQRKWARKEADLSKAPENSQLSHSDMGCYDFLQKFAKKLLTLPKPMCKYNVNTLHGRWTYN